LISSKGSILSKRFICLQVQNDYDIRSKMCIPSSKSPPPKNPNHENKAVAILVVPRKSAWRSLLGRIAEVV
jgi:hypothetical protein